jgi:quinol monooxygenase YgiN
MSQLTVVAQVTAKADAVAQVKSELLKLMEPTRNEAGCIEYNLHQDNADPARFIFYETWEDSASLEKHLITEHFTCYVAAVADQIESKVVYQLTRIA